MRQQVFFPARTAGHRAGLIEGTLDPAWGWALSLWLVNSCIWTPYCEYLSLLCHLGLDALSRTFLDLAVCRLPISCGSPAADARNSRLWSGLSKRSFRRK